MARNAQFRSAPESRAETSGGRLAVRIRQPRVQGREAHLGAVPDQQEEEPGLQPPHVKLRGALDEPVEGQGGDAAAAPRGTAAAMKYVPRSATAMPTEQRRMYFHAASSERWWRW